MIRERTSLNLAIGLALSLLLHLSLVIWGGLPFSLEVPALRSTSEVEVQLREWPASPAPSPSPDTFMIDEPKPPDAIRAPSAKPSLPPDVNVLREAVLSSTTVERPPVQPPDQLSSLSTLDSRIDPVRLSLESPPSLQPELQVAALPTLPDLPQPERARIEPNALPTLPALERAARREEPPARPAIVALPTPGVTSSIQGPAAERQVIFQPALPSVTVDTESELELRFWILPNGAVGRVVPVKKTDPRLEALAINYLRHWRFNPLPSGAPQDEQWGVIPFKFRIR